MGLLRGREDVCFAYVPTDPLPIFLYNPLHLVGCACGGGSGGGLTHSLGCLAVCFSQSEELAGDGRPESGKSQRECLLLSQVASLAVTVLWIWLLLGGPSLLGPSCHLALLRTWFVTAAL